MVLITTFLNGNSEPRKAVESSDYLLLAGIIDYEHDRGVPGVAEPLYSLDVVLSHLSPTEFLDGEEYEVIARIPIIKVRKDLSLESNYISFQLSPGHMRSFLQDEAEVLREDYEIEQIKGIYQASFHGMDKDIICKTDFGELFF